MGTKFTPRKFFTLIGVLLVCILSACSNGSTPTNPPRTNQATITQPPQATNMEAYTNVVRVLTFSGQQSVVPGMLITSGHQYIETWKVNSAETLPSSLTVRPLFRKMGDLSQKITLLRAGVSPISGGFYFVSIEFVAPAPGHYQEDYAVAQVNGGFLLDVLTLDINTTLAGTVPPPPLAHAVLRPIPQLPTPLQFNGDITIPDHSVIKAGTIQIKTWEVSDAYGAWGAHGYELVPVDAVQGTMIVPTLTGIDFFTPNRMGYVSMSFTAPTTPGMYYLLYAVQGQKGRCIPDVLTIVITVQ